MSIYIMMKIYAAAFGLCIGSFLNAVIYRLPRKISLMTRSQCPGCDKKILWYENIPVLSYFFLRGKCSGCGIKISIRYPLIELFTAICSVLLFPRDFMDMNSLALYFFYFSVVAVFIAHFFIDLEFKILPDSLNIYLLALFLLYGLTYSNMSFWLMGGAIGFLMPLGVAWAYYAWKKQVGLGGGDIKLYGILGLYLGPIGIVHNIFMSCLLGALIGGGLMAFKKVQKNQALPFGPAIILVAAMQIFFPKAFAVVISFIGQ